MKGSFSQTIVAGSLSRDPEMRYTPSGQAVTSFSIPVNRQWTDNTGEKKSETTWHNVTVWGKSAEACRQYLSKGSVVLVVGRLKPDPKTGNPRIFTKQNGEPGASFEITASEVRFMYTDPDGVENEFQGVTGPDETPFDDDDIPF